MARDPRPIKHEPLTPAEQETALHAAAQFLNDSYEVLTGTGRHADHERTQIGRCVRCACGLRVQGRLSDG